MGQEGVRLRFRHTSGDIGPYAFTESSTIQHIKDHLFEHWPADGPLSKEHPSSSADLRLLCSGKFLENGKTLLEYSKEMGDPEPGAIVTMHILVRQPAASKAAASLPASALGDWAWAQVATLNPCPIAAKDVPSPKPPKSGCGCTLS